MNICNIAFHVICMNPAGTNFISLSWEIKKILGDDDNGDDHGGGMVMMVIMTIEK